MGHITGGAFALSKSEETSSIGLLRFGNGKKALKEAELYNTATEKYEVIKAELSAGALGEIFEEALTEIETKPSEVFGWDQ